MMRRNENAKVREICRLGILVHNKNLEKILLLTKDWKNEKGKKRDKGILCNRGFFLWIFSNSHIVYLPAID